MNMKWNIRRFTEALKKEDISSLDAADSLAFSYKMGLPPDIRILNFVKERIRDHHGNYLSAMIYYSSLLNIQDATLWNMYEMQITRSARTSEMSLTSLIRSFQGLSRYSPTLVESFDMLELQISKSLVSPSVSTSLLPELIYLLSSLQLTKGCYSQVLSHLSSSKSSLTQCDTIKIIWSLSVTNHSPTELKDWLEHLASIPSQTSNPSLLTLTPYSNLMLNWVLSSISLIK